MSHTGLLIRDQRRTFAASASIIVPPAYVQQPEWQFSSPCACVCVCVTEDEDDDAATLHHTCILKFFYLLMLGFG